MTSMESRIQTVPSSSLNVISPISSLEDQYMPPLGQRLLIAVEANAACCLEGGVESILRLKGRSAALSSEGGTSGAPPQNLAYNQPQEDFDAFGFLNDNTEEQVAVNAGVAGDTNERGKGLGGFFRKVAASTSATLERQMQGLAVRIDKGRSADILRVGMYDPHTDELLATTEPLAFPQDARSDMRFRIPLVVNGRRRQQQFVLKLWIQSGAALLQTTKVAKCYLLGSTTIDCMKLQPGRVIAANLASNLLVGGQLNLCPFPDQKFSQFGRRGWSLSDPDMSAYSSDLCYLPLDQSYVFNGKRPEHWLLATERATESSIVLPLAAACMELWSKGAERSQQHASSIASMLRGNRHDFKTDSKATCTVKIVGMESPQFGDAVSTVSLCWRRPDSIFELELISNERMPALGQPSNAGLVFYPKVCTDGILPGVLHSFGGQLPASGFLLGALCFTVNVQVGDQINIWESVVGMEGFIDSPNSNFALPLMQNGNQMGKLHVQLQVAMPSQRGAQKTISPTDGLLSLVGLASLDKGVNPTIDSCSTDGGSEVPLRQQQLDTMGYFFTTQYMDGHMALRDSAVETFKERARAYKHALVQPERGAGHETKTPKAFRPSSSRSATLLSGIPFNCHVVHMNINVLDALRTTDQELPGATFHNVTHGAPSDHARGFGNVLQGISNTNAAGGLRRLETKRYEISQALEQAQSALIAGVGNYLSTSRRAGGNVNHVPARNTEIQGLRWRVFELVHSLHHLTWMCAIRRANCFSQALGLAVTSYLASISDASRTAAGWPEVWKRHGFLVCFEGLLSAAGKELGMIEDASIAIQMLRMVRIVLMPDKGIPSKAIFVPSSPHTKWVNLFASGQGKERHYLLQIGIEPSYYNERIPPPLRDGAAVQLYPLLFQVGVDIRQWGAHAGNNLMKQNGNKEISPGGLVDDDDDDAGIVDDDVLVSLNQEAMRKMNAYAHAINPKEIMLNDVQAAMNQQFSLLPGEPNTAQPLPIHPSMVALNSHIVSSAGRMNHSILDEAATLAQQLGGGGLVFCKSGKDRTAMHVTYKQAQFAARYRGQTDPEGILKDATTIRIHGTRLPICEKNVGQNKYAFNSLQVQFMPDALKPPANTLAGFLKGGRLFGEGAIES